MTIVRCYLNISVSMIFNESWESLFSLRFFMKPQDCNGLFSIPDRFIAFMTNVLWNFRCRNK